MHESFEESSKDPSLDPSKKCYDDPSLGPSREPLINPWAPKSPKLSSSLVYHLLTTHCSWTIFKKQFTCFWLWSKFTTITLVLKPQQKNNQIEKKLVYDYCTSLAKLIITVLVIVRYLEKCVHFVVI